MSNPFRASAQRRAAFLRTVAAPMALALTVGLSACGAGQISETAKQRSVVDGVGANIGDLSLRYIGFESAGASDYRPGADLKLTLVIVNNGKTNDQLIKVDAKETGAGQLYASGADYRPAPSGSAASSTSASASGNATATATGSATASATPSTTAGPKTVSSIELPAGLPVSFNVGSASGPLIVLPRSSVGLGGGERIRVTFTFANAGAVDVDVPVRLSPDGAENAPTVVFTPREH